MDKQKQHVKHSAAMQPKPCPQLVHELRSSQSCIIIVWRQLLQLLALQPQVDDVSIQSTGLLMGMPHAYFCSYHITKPLPHPVLARWPGWCLSRRLLWLQQPAAPWQCSSASSAACASAEPLSAWRSEAPPALGTLPESPPHLYSADQDHQYPAVVIMELILRTMTAALMHTSMLLL